MLWLVLIPSKLLNQGSGRVSCLLNVPLPSNVVRKSSIHRKLNHPKRWITALDEQVYQVKSHTFTKKS